MHVHRYVNNVVSNDFWILHIQLIHRKHRASFPHGLDDNFPFRIESPYHIIETLLGQHPNVTWASLSSSSSSSAPSWISTTPPKNCASAGAPMHPRNSIGFCLPPNWVGHLFSNRRHRSGMLWCIATAAACRGPIQQSHILSSNNMRFIVANWTQTVRSLSRLLDVNFKFRTGNFQKPTASCRSTNYARFKSDII